MSQSSTANNNLTLPAPFAGATSLIAGTGGGVTIPIAGNHTQFQKGNGTWSGVTTVSAGSPEAFVIGSVGDLYANSSTDQLYYKKTGTNNAAGWALVL